MTDKAIAKLTHESKSGKYDKHATVMKAEVLKTLQGFCQQNQAFAELVIEGGTFENCMKAVAKSCGSGISDIEAYRKAVLFYCPKAKVYCELRIELDTEQKRKAPEKAPEQTPRKPLSIVLNFADFL